MAKAPYYIDTNSADPTARIGLQWEADSIAVVNPTIYTIAVRAGSGSKPTADNADMVFPPTSALSLPTSAREYVVTATTPTLTNPPDNMPTRVSILLAKGEPPPAFGGIPLAGQPSPALVLLRDQPDRGVGSYADVVQVPAGITTLVLRQFGINMSALSVVGNTTGRTYWEPNAPFTGGYVNGTDGWAVTPNGSTAVIRFDRDLDAAITVNAVTVNPTTNGYTLYGYRERLPAGVYHSDGRLMVDVLPPGQTYLKVSSIVGAFPVQMPLYPDLPAAAGIAGGSVNAPAAGATIASLTVAAGDYRVSFCVSSNVPAGNGQLLVLTLPGGASWWLMHPINAPDIVVPRATLAAGNITVVNNLVSAGTQASALIQAHKIA